jgi:anti-anti-sigma factor
MLTMEVKTDTKEKFHVIRVQTPHLSANMAADMNKTLLQYLNNPPHNIVFDAGSVTSVDEEAAEALVRTQQKFYEEESSFVICNLTKEVEDFLDSKDLLELMNVTPTESEAWDIVQMEEIERELLGGEE